MTQRNPFDREFYAVVTDLGNHGLHFEELPLDLATTETPLQLAAGIDSVHKIFKFRPVDISTEIAEQWLEKILNEGVVDGDILPPFITNHVHNAYDRVLDNLPTGKLNEPLTAHDLGVGGLKAF